MNQAQTDAAQTLEQCGMHIDGKWLDDAERGRITVTRKWDGADVALIPVANDEDIRAAGDAAQRAFENVDLSPQQRYALLMEIAAVVEADREELTRLLVSDVGKTHKESVAEVGSAVQALIDAAEEAKRLVGEVIPVQAMSGSENRIAFTLFTPVGPVLAITPFNAPLNQAAHKVAAAIAAGNTVVVKPNPLTSLVTAHFVRLIVDRTSCPAGVVGLLYGEGEVGAALVADTRYQHISFTGSAAVGRSIRAAIGLRGVTLELGSNAPVIVHEDANLDLAADACVRSGYAIAGQVCTSVQRILVHRDVAEEFARRLVQRAQQLKVGDPSDPETDVGPMISLAGAERAERWMSQAMSRGAKLRLGGARDGRHFEPTILDHVTDDMDIVCQELFAPIMNLLRYDDLDEAFRRANDSQYGLQAGIFTASVGTAMLAAKRLRYGGVMVNDASRYRAANMPYGGVKDSGLGREGARYAIRGQCDMKTLVLLSEDS